MEGSVESKSSKKVVNSNRPESKKMDPESHSFGDEWFDSGSNVKAVDDLILEEFFSEMDYHNDLVAAVLSSEEHPPSREFDAEMVGRCHLHIEKVAPRQVVHYTPRAKEYHVCSQVGDDNLEFTNEPGSSIMKSVFSQTLFGMKVSLPDSGLSREIGNFTEKWMLMPKDHFDLSHMISVQGGDRTTPVLDIPPLRAILPVFPQVKTNVSSIEGKMSVVARNLAYAKGTADELVASKISIFQDVLLGVFSNSTRFPYLPESVGGLDKPFPFGSTQNVVRSMKAWKRGRYLNLLSYIVKASRKLLTSEVFQRDEFLEKVKDTYKGFQSWYATYKRNLPISKGMTPSWAGKYLLGSFSNDMTSNQVLRRLRAARMVVSETDLILANEVEQYTLSLLSEDMTTFNKVREATRLEYLREVVHANAFSVLHKEFVVADVSSNALSEDDLKFALKIDLNSTLKVKNFFFGERFYLREALDEVIIRGPHKVTFPLQYAGFRIQASEGDEDLGIECPDSDIDDLVLLLEWAKGNREVFPPRDLLEDDSVILSEVEELMRTSNHPVVVVILVSNDLRLGKKINEETGAVVVNIPPQIVLALRRGIVTSDTYGEQESLSDEMVFSDLKNRLLEKLGPARFAYIQSADLARVDIGNWEAESKKFDLFPFEKPEFYHERKVDYFEFRVERGGAQESMQRFYWNWPLGKQYVRDSLNVMGEKASSGNPSGKRMGNSFFLSRGPSGPVSKKFSQAVVKAKTTVMKRVLAGLRGPNVETNKRVDEGLVLQQLSPESNL